MATTTGERTRAGRQEALAAREGKKNVRQTWLLPKYHKGNWRGETDLSARNFPSGFKRFAAGATAVERLRGRTSSTRGMRRNRGLGLLLAEGFYALRPRVKKADRRPAGLERVG